MQPPPTLPEIPDSTTLPCADWRPGSGRYLVFGAGVSGLAAARLLRAYHADVWLVDEEAPARLDENISWLAKRGIKFQFGGWEPSLLDNCEAVVLSPGISYNHPLAVVARERGIIVTGELELGAGLASPPIFAITGTNGKTTTTALISHILTHNGFTAPSCGNIGRAFCDTILDHAPNQPSTILVTEVSSYQLETIDRFHPVAAWLLNVTPDHLARHGGMPGYIQAKFRVTRNQTPEDALAINADDPIAMMLSLQTRAQVWQFSAVNQVERGAYLDGGRLMLRCNRDADPFQLMRLAEIPLRGKHNVENVLAASLVTFFCDLSHEAVAKAIETFPGVEHRIEFVCEHNGVRYFNDSKATNVDAMAVALESFSEPIVLIAGGQDIGDDFTKALPLIERHVRLAILIGEAAPRLEKEWGATIPTTRADTLEDAAVLSGFKAQKGDVVLLSPGCKSFDMFQNFAHRGRVFKETLITSLGAQSMSAAIAG